MFHFVYKAKNEKFSILFDVNNGSLEFCYWHQYMGHSNLDENHAFKAKRKEAFMLDSDNDFSRMYEGIQRGLIVKDSAYKSSDNDLKIFSFYKEIKLPNKVCIIDGKGREGGLSLQDIKDACQKYPNKVLVFIDCAFKTKGVGHNEEPPLSSLKFNQDIAFFNCIFDGEVILRNSEILSSLWFVDCIFSNQFSLKKAKISRNVHMESNCFHGAGGVSFRGLRAKNLYVDFGTIGSDDMFWFNEMSISGVVSIGGVFKSKIQILSNQEYPKEYKKDTKIGQLHIGSEYSHRRADEDNSTISENIIEVGGLKVQNIHISNMEAKHFLITDNRCLDSINLYNISATSDFEANNNTICNSFSLDKSGIGRHLFLQKNTLPSLVSIAGTSVSEVSYVEGNKFQETSNINFSRFTTSKLMLHPVQALYAGENSSIFKPKKFSLLMANASDLGDQYCALKHWLADAGKLKEEDIAYFYMNEIFNKNSMWSKFVLGTIFGWGVRLTNIVVSSFILMLIFFGIYVSYGMSEIASIAVTIQGFFGVLIDPIFDQWRYLPDVVITGPDSGKVSGIDIPSWLLTLESILGVLFITVLVGAYVRKMLR